MTTNPIHETISAVKSHFNGWVSQSRLEEIAQEAIAVSRIHEPSDLLNDLLFFSLGPKEWQDRWSSIMGGDDMRMVSAIYTKWMHDKPAIITPSTIIKTPDNERQKRLTNFLVGFGFGSGMGALVHYILAFFGISNQWLTCFLVLTMWYFCHPFLIHTQ